MLDVSVYGRFILERVGFLLLELHIGAGRYILVAGVCVGLPSLVDAAGMGKNKGPGQFGFGLTAGPVGCVLAFVNTDVEAPVIGQ